MKTKSIYLLLSISLIILIIVLRKYVSTSLDDTLGDISKWGEYLFVTPITYCLLQSFSSTAKYNSNKAIGAIVMGAIAIILLNTDFTNSYFVPKIVATITGAGIIWLINSMYLSKK